VNPRKHRGRRIGNNADTDAIIYKWKAGVGKKIPRGVEQDRVITEGESGPSTLKSCQARGRGILWVRTKKDGLSKEPVFFGAFFTGGGNA